MKIVIIKQHLKNIFTFLGLPIIGVVLTLIFQQAFFRKNKVTEESIKVSVKYVQDNFQLLNKIRKIQELSSQDYISSISMSYLEDGIEVANDSIGYVFRLPKVVKDRELYEQWSTLFQEVFNKESELDRDIFIAAKDVWDFHVANPFPRLSNPLNVEDFERVEQSGWNDFQTIGRWNTLVEMLRIKVDRRLDIVKDKYLIE